MTSKKEAEERKLELERKKQRLAEMREDKRRREEERRRNLLRNIGIENGAASGPPKTLLQKDLDEILEPVGIPSLPPIEQSPAAKSDSQAIFSSE
ncbi:unnamed protein product [Dracunculus medinensis]|uniref:Cytoplasmic dynein 1 intermediate chain 1 n=1 Tax=Dracunculus medinensis TaxID=318479 RepID=A0A0N4U0U9_DRAME|nr:unnamed protein product [Dracunculus medinensis]